MLGPSLDYTNRDFDSVRARLLSSLKSVFPTWTDNAVSDFGTILLDAFAFVGDVAMFNLDAAALEAKWGTATQLRSFLRLAKLIAYTPKGASAATTSETLSAADLVANVTIPAGTLILTRGNDPVSFQTLAEVTLTPAAPSAEVDVENSFSFTETFSPTSDAFQTKILGQTPYLRESLVVTSVQGTWTRVDNFLASRPTDLHYVETVDANDQCTITFGNGSLGSIPIGTTTFAYKTGGGTVGMVDPGSITEIQGTFNDTLSNQVTVVATNAAATVGGAEKESVDTIRVQAPATIRSGNRTVSREDFEARARKAAGVGRCLLLTRSEDPAVDLNAGALWVVPTGTGFLTSTIRSAITTQYAQYPYAPSFGLTVYDPEYLDVYIYARIFLQANAKPSKVKQDVLASLAAWFALTATDELGNVIDNPTSNFGYYTQDADGVPVGSIGYSDLFNVVRDVPGIRRVGGNTEDFLLTSQRTVVAGSLIVQDHVHADLTITPRQYPRFLGASALILENGDTGVTL